MKKNKHSIVVIIFVVVLSFVLCSCATPEEKIENYLQHGEWEKAVVEYNNNIAISPELSQTVDPIVDEAIEEIKNSWMADELTYEEAASGLSLLKTIDSKTISEKATNELNYIEIENNGSERLATAETLFEEGKYSDALCELVKIDSNYSLYDSSKTFYDECVELLLIGISEPSTIEEYEQCIDKIDDYIEIVNDERFSERKSLLEKEKPDFERACPLIQKAESLYNSDKYSESFALLEQGLIKHPSNRFISEALVEYHNLYIVNTLTNVGELVTNEEYSEALEIIAKARENYDCEEFKDAKKAIWKERNVVVRLAYNTIDYFNTAGGKWTSEEFDVKETAEDGVKYIIKSGKKFLLGDYDGEEITVLSFTGSVAAALAGLDFGLDIRDLTYDITHIEDEEYIVLFLAADVVALIPVIGVVKYIKNLNKSNKVSKALLNLINVGADSSKVTAEIVERAAKEGKTEEQAGKIAKILSGHYKNIETTNAKYVGKLHPDTGIKFELKKLTYSDGSKIKGVFPKFDSFCDIKLPADYYKASFAAQKKYLSPKLKDAIKNPLIRKRFTKEQIEQINDGFIPEEFVWHHNEKEGLMQLVDKEIHAKTGHDGGMSLWGRGYD